MKGRKEVSPEEAVDFLKESYVSLISYIPGMYEVSKF
jgi:hypothetical protein